MFAVYGPGVVGRLQLFVFGFGIECMQAHLSRCFFVKSSFRVFHMKYPSIVDAVTVAGNITFRIENISYVACMNCVQCINSTSRPINKVTKN